MSEPKVEENIYGLIQLIQKRPGMYITDKSLNEISLTLSGYSNALRINNITEDYAGRTFTTSAFSQWLNKKEGWCRYSHFASNIMVKSQTADEAFKLFFELAEEYRFSSEG